MARIFISYSRADRQFIDQFIPLIRRVYGNDSLWYDADIHGGVDWWQMILNEVGECDLFIYLLSNESLTSPYCQAELREALRLKKQILPVIVRRLNPSFPGGIDEDLAPELRKRQYVDFSGGFRDASTSAELYAAINRLLNLAESQTKTPTSTLPTPEPHVSDKKKPDSNIRAAYIGGVFLLVSVILAGLFGLWQGVFANTDDRTPVPSPTAVVQQQTDPPAPPTDTPTPLTDTPALSADDARATGAAQAYQTLTALAPTDTPTITPTPTETPVSVSDIQRTAQAEIFATETTSAQTQVAIAQETQRAVLTEQFNAGSTATYIAQLSLTPLPTNTPTATPTLTSPPTLSPFEQVQTVEALLLLTTVAQQRAATDAAANATLLALSATATPTPTRTPTATHTPDPLQAAFTPVARNADWTSVERDFDGVTMVLVPVGCFDMGSEDGESDEQPVHEICFDAPFWIDLTEVTQADFERLGGVQAELPHFSDANRPVENITWFEARQFCESRGARLPTEAEWEYAARGPQGWVYPWGDDLVAANVVSSENSNDQTAEVGSRPGGASWVGALDMSGNVLEWTSSLYEAYPYDATDGRERDTGNSTDVLRVLRGGSWINNYTAFLRAGFRNRYYPDNRYYYLGFRCARS